jgi:hypothetical protein
MIAQVGDRLVMRGIHVGDSERVGVITGIKNSDGTPPYVVRWLDSGRETLVFPGSEALVQSSSVQSR